MTDRPTDRTPGGSQNGETPQGRAFRAARELLSYRGQRSGTDSQLRRARLLLREEATEEALKLAGQLLSRLENESARPSAPERRALEGAAHVVVGVAQRRLGRGDEADASFARAVERFEAAGVDESAPREVVRDYGHALNETGRTAEAVPLLESALRGDDDETDARVALAQALERTGRPYEAVDHYVLAVQQRLDASDYDGALAILEQAELLAPDDERFGWLKGEALRHLGRLEEAVAAVEVFGDFSLALGTKAAALITLGHLEEALEALDKALVLDPEYEFGLLARADLHVMTDRLEEALADLDRLVEIAPGLQSGRALRGETLRLLGRPEEAKEELDFALSLDPDDVVALERRGEVLRVLGEHESALADLDRALDVKPDSLFGRGTRGGVLRRLGRLDEAEDDLTWAIEHDPEYAFALAERGEVRRLQERLDEALEDLDAAIRLNPDYAFVHGTRGAVLHGLDRSEEALEAFDRALSLDPDYRFARAWRGDALRMLDRPQEALVELDRVLEADPEDVFALRARGDVLLSLGRMEAALEDLDRAVDLDPDDADSRIFRAQALRVDFRYEEALEDLDRAVDIAPESGLAWGRRADVLRMLDRHDEALENIEQALERSPDWANALGMRGEILRMLDRDEEAERDFRKVVELNPDNAFVHGSLAELARTSGRHAAALEDANRALELAGGQYPWAKAVRGLVRLDTGDYELAVSDLRGALDEEPRLYFAYAALAAGLEVLGRFEEGLEAYAAWRAVEGATRWSDTEARMLGWKGRLHRRKGQPEEARRSFEAAAKLLGPVDPDDLDHIDIDELRLRAFIARGLLRWDEAAHLYLRILSVQPDDYEAQLELALVMICAGQAELGLQELKSGLEEAKRRADPLRVRGLVRRLSVHLDHLVQDGLAERTETVGRALAYLQAADAAVEQEAVEAEGERSAGS